MILMWLDQLNRYANLILVVVTAIYAFLTLRMVWEMRRTREAEREAHLVAVLFPNVPGYAMLQIHNVGGGPALNIEGVFRLEPLDGAEAVKWRHPALLPGTHEEFLLPSKESVIDEIAARHDKLIVEVKWSNASQKTQCAKYEVDLRRQIEGWNKSGQVFYPRDVPTQLESITRELSAIRQHLDDARRTELEKRERWNWLYRDNLLWQRLKKFRELIKF